MSTVVSDSCTEATTDTTFASHTPEIGGPVVSHPIYSGTALVNASLDRVYLNSAAAGGYYYTGTPGGADYYVQMDFYRLSQLSTNVGILLGMDTSADTGVLLRLNDNGAGVVVWDLFDRVAGSNNSLISGVAAHIPTLGGSPVTAKLVRTSTSITCFFDGVQDTNFNQTTSITAIGKAGVRFSGTASSSTGIHGKNITAVDSGATVVPTMGYLKGPYLRPAIFKPGRAR
jgi:hypothetical protein